MATHYDYDGVIIGAGPNGLAAAITLARAGARVLVLEAAETVGGGCRSKPLTLPGFVHDVCSAIHPLGVDSTFFRLLPLEQYGLTWIEPPAALAHPLDDGTAALLERDFAATGATLGGDAVAWRRLFGPLARGWHALEGEILSPLHLPDPRHLPLLARFGLNALQPATWLAQQQFRGDHARALFMGMAAHSFLRLDQIASAAAGLVLGSLGHAVGWPLPQGGSQAIVDALAAYLQALGGEIRTGEQVMDIARLPSARAYLFDVTPRQLVRIAGARLPAPYRRQLGRYRYGPGVFKLDYALDGPIPWRAAACARAGTVHLGGTAPEIAASEGAVNRGRVSARPFVLLAQQSLFDPTRAPAGKHTVWAYCHVPHGSRVDMTARIEAQIERFAPGFRSRILARHVITPQALEAYNANYIGGDIGGGVQDLRQLYTRPTPRLSPYTTPARDIYLCSSSTPPGGGVHGLCGYYAAQAALRAAL